ncbi:MAG: hypothetical protein NXI31_18145 [bacterium]|nr:hypothetical protein [bacterium]
MIQLRNLPALAAASSILMGLLPTVTAQAPLQVRAVVPAAAAGAEGNSVMQVPWGQQESRTMCLYGAEHAPSDQTMRILGVRFRRNGGSTQVTAGNFPNLRVDVSTGARNPNGNGLNLAVQHGGDKTRVYDAAFNVPAQTTSGSVSPFTVTIPFDVPFEWDPKCGPFVLDIRTWGAGTPTNLNWDAVSDSGLATLYSPNWNLAAASSRTSEALAIQFLLDTDTLPKTVEATEGASDTGYPWGQTTAEYRVMDIYNRNAMDFAGRTRITALSWRSNEFTSSAAATFDCRITMSTTASSPQNAVIRFNQNHGADKTLVYEGPLAFSNTSSGPGPRRYTRVCELQTPFEYNPDEGHLVVEVQVLSHDVSAIAQIDAVPVASNPVRRILNNTDAFGSEGTLTPSNVAVLGVVGEPIPTLPANLDSVRGNGSLATPLNQASGRSMFLYTGLHAPSTAPIWIDSLAFRPNSPTGPVGPATWTVTIDLSEAAISNGPLAVNFDSNHGLRRQRVFDGKFSAPLITDTSDASAFPITVKLDTPFYWDPAGAPLLVDIRVTDRNGNGIALDSQGASGIWRATANDANATTAISTSQNALCIRLGATHGNALAEEYGAGCAGANGTPRCFTNSLPWLPNPDLELLLRDGPSVSACFVLLGLTEATTPLDGFGLPGCVGLNNREFGSILTFTDPGGNGTLALALPDVPELAGLPILQQWACLDPTANMTGVSFSNGQRLITSH